jgi:hypothetical protein
MMTRSQRGKTPVGLANPGGTSNSADLTPENETIDLAAKQTAMEARIQQLEELKALHEKEANLLRELRAAGAPLGGTAPKPRRGDDSSSESGGEVKVKNITMLTSQTTLRKRDEWLGDLQRAFQGAKRRYNREYKRVLLALDHMDAECRARWDRHLDEQEESDQLILENSWEKFMEWTLSLIKDATNREPHLMKQLADARQRDNQSPIEFHSYLDSLEKHFPRQEEKHRALTFYAKLTDELRNHIDLHCLKMPENREEMLAIATRYWESKGRERKRKSQRDPPETYHPRPAKRFQRATPAFTRIVQTTDKEIIAPGARKNPVGAEGHRLKCFGCGSEDHLQNRCPKARITEVKASRAPRREGPDYLAKNGRALRGTPMPQRGWKAR